jgi:hypothetical protein
MRETTREQETEQPNNIILDAIFGLDSFSPRLIVSIPDCFEYILLHLFTFGCTDPFRPVQAQARAQQSNPQ